jgi:hypothetical protein
MDGQMPGEPLPADDGSGAPEPAPVHGPDTGPVFDPDSSPAPKLDPIPGPGLVPEDDFDALRPGPVLAARTARAVSRAGYLADDELICALQDARRLANLADYQQTVVIAEYARHRQAQFEAAQARGVPVGCRDGEFPGEELAMELVETGA